MRAAVDRVDRVRETELHLREAVVVLERRLDLRRVHRLLDVDRARRQRVAALVHVADEARDATLEAEVHLPLAPGPLVLEADPDALRQVRHLAEPLEQQARSRGRWRRRSRRPAASLSSCRCAPASPRPSSSACPSGCRARSPAGTPCCRAAPRRTSCARARSPPTRRRRAGRPTPCRRRRRTYRRRAAPS